MILWLVGVVGAHDHVVVQPGIPVINGTYHLRLLLQHKYPSTATGCRGHVLEEDLFVCGCRHKPRWRVTVQQEEAQRLPVLEVVQRLAQIADSERLADLPTAAVYKAAVPARVVWAIRPVVNVESAAQVV